MSYTASSDPHAVEPFWARVRSTLGALRARQERIPAYGQAAIARSMGMKPRLGALIDEELQQGWASAAALRVSMCLLVIELDRFDEYFASYGKDSADECLDQVRQAIAATLQRPDDVCLRMGRNSFVVVLPDLPVLMAKSLVGKIAASVKALSLPHRESHAGIITISQGLAVTNPRGTYDKKFFETAATALKRARRKGLGRSESIDLRPALERKSKRKEPRAA